jgi:hypothetical protein
LAVEAVVYIMVLRLVEEPEMQEALVVEEVVVRVVERVVLVEQERQIKGMLVARGIQPHLVIILVVVEVALVQ